MKKNTTTTERTNAFTDGVFAIAITLLVLNLQLPDNLTNPTFSKMLIYSLPKLQVWLISFWIIGGMWLDHHEFMSKVKCVNSIFLRLNILYLMIITLIPWLVSLITKETPITSASVAFFSSICLIPGIIKLLKWKYASKNKRLINAEISKKDIKYETLNCLSSPVVGITSIICAYLISPELGLYCWFLKLPYKLILDKILYKKISEH